eukprot:3448293-Prymnesium_polylepis.2
MARVSPGVAGSARSWAVVRHGLRKVEQGGAKAWYDEAEGLVRTAAATPRFDAATPRRRHALACHGASRLCQAVVPSV